jgi:hypothetical protein
MQFNALHSLLSVDLETVRGDGFQLRTDSVIHVGTPSSSMNQEIKVGGISAEEVMHGGEGEAKSRGFGAAQPRPAHQVVNSRLTGVGRRQEISGVYSGDLAIAWKGDAD